MQVMPKTAEYVYQLAGERLSLPSPLVIDDPNYNIALGSAYFSDLMNDHQQNRILSLAAYNAGPRRSTTMDKAPPTPGRLDRVHSLC